MDRLWWLARPLNWLWFYVLMTQAKSFSIPYQLVHFPVEGFMLSLACVFWRKSFGKFPSYVNRGGERRRGSSIRYLSQEKKKKIREAGDTTSFSFAPWPPFKSPPPIQGFRQNLNLIKWQMVPRTGKKKAEFRSKKFAKEKKRTSFPSYPPAGGEGRPKKILPRK